MTANLVWTIIYMCAGQLDSKTDDVQSHLEPTADELFWLHGHFSMDGGTANNKYLILIHVSCQSSICAQLFVDSSAPSACLD